MEFALICIGSIVLLGIVAALASIFTKGGTDEPVIEAHDCASCSSKASGDCKIACLMEEKKLRESNKSDI
jgi:hypothetical protein